MYRYLNVDEEILYDSETELYDSFDKGSYVIKAIPDFQYEHILIAAGKSNFSEQKAIMGI